MFPVADMAPATTPPVAPAKTVDRSASDADVIAGLFASQVRDPVWAPGAEALIRSRTPYSSMVTCAEFMCCVQIPSFARPDEDEAERQAIAASRDWPAGLAYNRDTAMIVGDRQVPMLVFYVTKPADEGEMVATDG